ncbi:MAG: sulfatase, partial [Planctomycetales bacterium]|nr:sulfatase [Planctomycetales bacterium]
MISKDSARHQQLMTTRRQLFGRAALGLGTASLANLMRDDLHAAGLPKPVAGGGLHHAPTAKRVIYLFMSGGPSQHD